MDYRIVITKRIRADSDFIAMQVATRLVAELRDAGEIKAEIFKLFDDIPAQANKSTIKGRD